MRLPAHAWHLLLRTRLSRGPRTMLLESKDFLERLRIGVHSSIFKLETRKGAFIVNLRLAHIQRSLYKSPIFQNAWRIQTSKGPHLYVEAQRTWVSRRQLCSIATAPAMPDEEVIERRCAVSSAIFLLGSPRTNLCPFSCCYKIGSSSYYLQDLSKSLPPTNASLLESQWNTDPCFSGQSHLRNIALWSEEVKSN